MSNVKSDYNSVEIVNDEASWIIVSKNDFTNKDWKTFENFSIEKSQTSFIKWIRTVTFPKIKCSKDDLLILSNILVQLQEKNII